MICRIDINLMHTSFVNVHDMVEAEHIADAAVMALSRRRPPKVTSVVEQYETDCILTTATEMYITGHSMDEIHGWLLDQIGKRMPDDAKHYVISGLMKEVQQRAVLKRSAEMMDDLLDVKVIHSSPRDVFENEYTELRLILQSNNKWVVGIWHGWTGQMTDVKTYSLCDFAEAQMNFLGRCKKYYAAEDNR